MDKTTLSKTTRAAELLAACMVINELVKDAYIVENLDEHSIKLDLLATLVTGTFTPAEA